MSDNVAEAMGDLSVNDTKKAAASEKRAAKKKAKNKDVVESQYPTEIEPSPEFIAHRDAMFVRLKKEYDDWVGEQLPDPITVTLPDGKTVEGKAWRTTPYDIAVGISKGLADNTIVAKVNDVVWDLDRPFEKNSTLSLLKFDDPEGQYVFWHSSAHVLGEAMERHYGGCLCYGPPVDDGFYYDMFIEDRQVTQADYQQLEKVVKKVTNDKQPFERLEIKKADLIEMFTFNKFKQRLIEERVQTPTTTVYKCGPLIDLCRGPHLRHTGKVKSFKVINHSSAYWQGKSDAETLQRVYGISFPDSKRLKEWQKFQAEAALRDHRKIGMAQELFFFHELSPGSCFFQPRGAFIYNTLINFIKGEYVKRGFQEVITPNLYNSKLWKTSGHWQHYSDGMYSFDVDSQKFALKPMNCPGHCLIFDHRNRSWRELPLRLADFGVLHRKEISGALTGLTRVIRFQQDDAHIFCSHQQIKQEMAGCLDFLKHVYSVFGFTFQLKLSTRPEKYLGEVEVWDKAEKQLEESLVEFGEKWEYNPGDGAFYGPKIDITIMDALKRHHQCATIQLDFQLPERFDLSFVGQDNEKVRPVMIHRAILGSVERMMAILCEHYGGKWPFWLSPRQAIIIPVAPPFNEYAEQVGRKLQLLNFQCDVNVEAGNTLNKKIRNGQLDQYNFIFVVGEAEMNNSTLNVRTRDNKVHGEHKVDYVIEKLNHFRDAQTVNTEDEF